MRLVPLPLLAALLCLGCPSARDVEFKQGDAEHATADGLYPVKTGLEVGVRGFAKPGTDLAVYDKVMLDDVHVRLQRRSVKPTQAQMQSLQQKFHHTFGKELARSRVYTVVSEPGPDVLRVDCELQDVLITRPPSPPADDDSGRVGREKVRQRSAAWVTLVLELSDSESDEILVRVGQRSRMRGPFEGPEPVPEIGQYSNSDIERAFANWALRLRDWLDHVREIPPLPERPEAETAGG